MFDVNGLLLRSLAVTPFERRANCVLDRCNPKAGANSVWVATALDIATDVMVAVLPISLLVGLRMSLKKKIAIGAIFALGAVVIFFSVFRMVKVLEAIGAESPKILLSLALWSMLEAAVGTFLPISTKQKHGTSLTNHSCHRRLTTYSQGAHLPEGPKRLHRAKKQRRHIWRQRPVCTSI